MVIIVVLLAVAQWLRKWKKRVRIDHQPLKLAFHLQHDQKCYGKKNGKFKRKIQYVN